MVLATPMPDGPCGSSRSCVWRAANKLTAGGRITFANELCIAITSSGEPCGRRVARYFAGDESDDFNGQPFCDLHAKDLIAAIVAEYGFMYQPPVVPRAAKQKVKPEPPRGFVYFVRRANQIKIGYTGDPKKRIRDLELMGGSGFDDVVIRRGDRALEMEYHRQFANRRITGEWFAVCDEILTEMDLLRPDDPIAAARRGLVPTFP